MSQTKEILNKIKNEFLDKLSELPFPEQKITIPDVLWLVSQIIDKEIRNIYIPTIHPFRERAYLVSFISKCFPASLEPAEDCKDDPNFNFVIYIETPKGQISYHLHNNDLDLFYHVKRDLGNKWDGHNTLEKYERIKKLEKKDIK